MPKKVKVSPKVDFFFDLRGIRTLDLQHASLELYSGAQKSDRLPCFILQKTHLEGRGLAQMGRPCPLYFWSINSIHFKVKTFKNERFLSSSFGMADICILEWSFMADFSTIWMICKVQMCAISKLLDENCSFFDRLPLKCIHMID